MNTTAQELNERLDRRASEISALRRLWKSLLSVDCPKDQQFGWWLSSHAFGLLSFAITETAAKERRMLETESEAMTADHAIRFCSKVCLSNSRSMMPRKPSYTERVAPL
jgi:hypothetical protein